MQNGFLKIKSKIIDRIVVLTSIFLFLPVIFSLLRIFEIGWKRIFLFHVILYIIILITALLRKRLSTSFKIIVLSAIFFLITLLGLFYFSLAGGYFYAIMVIAILSLLVNRKITIWLMAFFILVFILFAVLYTQQFLVPSVDLNILSQSAFHWISHIISLFLLIAIFVYAFGDVYREITYSFDIKESIEKKYQMLFEKANDAIILLTEDIIFDCNKRACEYFQFARIDLIGKSLTELSPEHQYDGQNSEEKARHLLSLIMQGKSMQFEWQHKRGNGELFDTSVSLSKAKLLDGIYAQAILRDITDKKSKEAELNLYKNNLEELVKLKTDQIQDATEEVRATNEELYQKNDIIEQQNTELQATVDHLKDTQVRLLQSEKMASLGTLTAGVSHEINNPLNYIMGAFYGLESYFKEYGSKNKEKTDIFLKSIQEGLDRSTKIVRELNQLSPHNMRMDERCDLHDLLNNCLQKLETKTTPEIHFYKKFASHKIECIGNPSQLKQAFTNILLNAILSVHNKGNITIETKNLSDNTQVIISDDGCGIEEEHIPQITDPFFTTRSPGEGTGLGLSITYTIIKNHKGEIEFISKINEGTKVTINLPKKT